MSDISKNKHRKTIKDKETPNLIKSGDILEENNLFIMHSVNYNKNIEKTNSINKVPVELNDPHKKLLGFFKGKKIYIEIFNQNISVSNTFYEKLAKYDIIPCKRLSKNIDYICL